jgi:hypothetical protein
MDIKTLKRLIKETVKEAIQEELKDVLLEALRSPKTVPVGVGGYRQVTETYVQPHIQTIPTAPPVNTREKYASLLNSMLDSRNGNINVGSNDALNFGASQEYRPSAAANTAAEGSSLPAGEVNLNQIMGLMTKK